MYFGFSNQFLKDLLSAAELNFNMKLSLSNFNILLFILMYLNLFTQVKYSFISAVKVRINTINTTGLKKMR